MKTFKRTSVIFLVMLMLTAIFPLSASALITSKGDFTYEINASTHEATLVEYTGSSSEPKIPESVYDFKVTVIGNSAFFCNRTVRKITIPNTVKSIGNYAFSNCTALEQAIVPESVQFLGDGIFSGCTSLTDAKVNAEVSYLPESAFNNCKALTNVTLSESINQIKDSAFYGCLSLASVPSQDNIKSISQCAFYKSGITEAILPNGITELPNYSFGGSSSLKLILIPKSVTNISSTALKGSDNVKIYCYKGSYAHTFAESNGVPCFTLQTGDANLDEQVNINDATDIQKYIASLQPLSEIGLLLADADGNGSINITDATLVQKSIAGLTTLE